MGDKGVRGAATYGNGPLRPYSEIREWRLDPWHCNAEGREYLLDRQTGLVYALAAKAAAAAVSGTAGRRRDVPVGAEEDTTWPVLIGARMQDGRVRRLESTLSEWNLRDPVLLHVAQAAREVALGAER